MNFDEKFWLAISFVLFIILAYKPIKKAILEMIDRRIDMIRSDLENAKNMRINAEATLKELEKKLNYTIEERETLIMTAKDDVDKILAESTSELEIMIKLKENDAKNRLEQLNTNANRDLEKIFTAATKDLVKDYLNNHKSELPSDAQIAYNLLKK